MGQKKRVCSSGKHVDGEELYKEKNVKARILKGELSAFPEAV